MRKHQLILVYSALIALGIFLLPMANCIKSNSEKNNAPQLVSAESEQSKEVNFVLPINQGKLSAKFGPIKHPIKEGNYNHRGVDISAVSGTEVYAAAEGKVLSAISEYQVNKGPGKYILLQHLDNFQTRYCHLDTIYVHEGQSVKAGELIGGAGVTGVSTGPHLHFEIILDNEVQDPEKYIDFKYLKSVDSD